MKHADLTSHLGRVLVGLGLAGVLVGPAWAGGLRELDQKIFGMDCAPCAAGVEQGLSKLPGVASVRVSLNDGKAIVTLAPDSRTTVAQIREVIRHNGFTPKDARASLVGRLARDGDRLWIDTGSERFVVESDGAARDGQGAAEETRENAQLTVLIPEKFAGPPAVTLLSPVTTTR